MNPYIYHLLNTLHDVASIIVMVLGVLLVVGILMYFMIIEDHEEEVIAKAKRIFYLGLIIFAFSLFYIIFVPDGYTYQKMYEHNVKLEQRK